MMTAGYRRTRRTATAGRLRAVGIGPLPRVLLTVALAVATAGPAHAQEEDGPSASEVAAARDLFRSGVAAIGEERWEDAANDFERSYALAPRPNTLLNLAAAQSELGRVVAAIESYRTFLSLSGGGGQHRGDVEAALEELEPRVAHVTLEIVGIQEGDELQLDGSTLPEAGLGLPLPMDAGEHVFVVQRRGESVGRVRLTLVEGEERGVTIPLRATAPPPDEPVGPGGGDDLLTSPWLWLGVGGGVLVLALAIGLGVGLSEQSPSYFSGTFGDGMVFFE